MIDCFAIAVANLTGGKLADWKPAHAGTDGAAVGGCPDVITFDARPGAAPIPAAPVTPTQEKPPMTFRADLRAAIAKAIAISYTDLEKKFPGRNNATPLSQMTSAKQLRREGSRKDAIYTLGKKGEAKVAPSAATPATKKKPSGPYHKKRAGRKLWDAGLPPLVRGNHIEGAIAELRARREGIDTAIAVLEALA